MHRVRHDIVVIVAVQVRLERKDGQAIDADAIADRFVARQHYRSPAIVSAVARDIDDATEAEKRAGGEKKARIIDRATDGGAAPEQLPLRRFNRIGERIHGDFVLNEGPIDSLYVQFRTGPLHHGNCDRLRDQRAD